MTSGSAQRDPGGLLADLAAAVSLAVLPFAVFVQHHAHGLLRGDTLLCAGVLGLAGLALGLLAWLGGSLVRAGVLGLLVTYVLDVQLDEAATRGAILLGSFAGVAIAAWWLGPLASRIAAVAGAAMLLTTLVLPGGDSAWSEQGAIAAPGGTDPPPLFIHVILDEQIGVEGIPAEFDPAGEAARRLRDFYTGHGFRVFGRAYTRFDDTFLTLSNVLNFRMRARPTVSPWLESLGDARYFDAMRRRGYRIHVVQTDYMDLCHVHGALQADYCLTYTLERPQAVGSGDAALAVRAWLLGAMYARLSLLLSQLPLSSTLEAWGQVRTSSVSAFEVMGRVQPELERARPGQLWLVHLLLPHSPYALDRDCRLRSGVWLQNLAGSDATGWFVDEESRAERYPLYLEQVECLHRRLGEWLDALADAGTLADAIVLVHGDHGSRITLSFERKLPWPESAYPDSRSTLFAIRTPGGSGGYDRRLLPLHRLFARFVRRNEIPPGTDWAGRPRIMVGDRTIPMHPFERPDLATAE